MTPTDKTEELMRLAPSSELANVAFNWAQHPGYVLTQADCDMLHSLRLKHDADRSTLRAAIEKALSDAMANAHAEGMGDALEELRDELAELERYRAGTPGWLPIEQAPKDGTYILVTNGHGAWVARWAPIAASGYRFDQPWRSWMLNHDHIDRAKRDGEPTGWMPMPPAQSSQAEPEPFASIFAEDGPSVRAGDGVINSLHIKGVHGLSITSGPTGNYQRYKCDRCGNIVLEGDGFVAALSKSLTCKCGGRPVLETPPAAEPAAGPWRVEWDNDTGSDDGAYWEWWNVINDTTKTSYRAETKEAAERLVSLLNAQPAAEPAGITLTVEGASPHFGTAYASDARGRRCLLNTGTKGIDFASLKPGMRLVAVVNERNFVVSATVEGE